MDGKDNFWYCSAMPTANELKEIKKEIIEARGLIIKSNNLANSLSAEVRSIAKRQASYERHMSWNSIVAYIIFVILIFIGAQLVYNQRQTALEESITKEKSRADAAEKEIAKLKKDRRPDNKTSGEDLLALYELIHDRDRQAAIDTFEKVNQEQLTPLELKLLEDSIENFRSDLSMIHYARGHELMGEKKFAEAVEEFRTSLRFKGDAGHATAAKIEMANALRLQGKPREAIAVLQRLMEEHLDRALSDDAYWFLALSHQEAHQRDEARSVLRALMRQFPDSQYYRAARIKAAEIQLHLYSSGN
ncbi:MAG: tetratricopeptide repeat protein [Proteobacteria bacterium]|nr:tetratricopeptide repeat protein [Pseudomonadota bacterium]